MATALSVYMTKTTSGTISTACTLLENASTGATLSNFNTNLTSGTTGWVEIWSQGDSTAQSGAGSEPSPSGHGWCDDTTTTLSGNSFVAGTWSFALGFECTTTGTFVADFHFRAYQRSSSGTYTLIVEAVASSQTIISSSYTVVNASTSASASNTFASTDHLYIDCIMNITTNSTTGNMRMQASSSSTVGSTSAESVTPGYSSVTTNTRTVPATAALQSTLTRTIPATTALQSTLTRTIPATTALQGTLTRTIPATAAIGSIRTIPATAALQSTNTRTIPATVSLVKIRTIPATAALQSTLARNIPATTALQSTLTRMVPATASLTFQGTRTIPATVALYTPAVFYASNVPATISSLILSDQMSMVLGGTETSFTVTAPSSGTNSYVELVSQGGTPGSTLALPAPTGRGWSINLQGYTILAGNWFSTFTLAKSGTSMSGASLIVRYYRRTMDGTCYPIAISTLTAQTYSTSKTSHITPSVSATLWQFIQNDVLYMDAFIWNGSTSWNSDVFTVYVSNSATMGVANDGTTTAPELITTPAGLSCYVSIPSFESGATIPVLNESFTLADALDQRSVLTLTGEDANGDLFYTPNMPVMLSDSVQGKLYDGYLASDKMSRVVAGPGSPQLEHQMTFADHHRDFDKEANTVNYLNWTAGDIICDIIQQQQYKNGITGEFALESDYTQATFAQGTLTNAVATTTTSPFTYAPNTATPPVTSNTGDLELTRAGTQFSLTESVTSDFSSGTLTNMTASNNELTPTTQSAIKMTALYSPVATAQNAAAQESGGIQSGGEYILNKAAAQIWAGSMTIGTNDTFNYDLWIASSSPAFLACVDIFCSDGSTISGSNGTLDSNGNVGLVDQNGISVDFVQDLSAYAKDTWYTRNIALTGLNGKTINSIWINITGSSTGTYTIFTKNIYLSSQSSSPFFGTSATDPQSNPPPIATTGGYISSTVNTSVVQVYNPLTSYRISPAHSISGVGLVQNSTITWTASLPTTGGPIPTYPPGTTSSPSSDVTISSLSSGVAGGTISGSSAAMVLMVSYDGSTWLQCQNSQALPGLPPGANVSGLSLYLREQFASGPDPSAIPALLQVQITINSAANQTVSDIVTAYGTATQWNTGTQVLTGPNANGNLTLGSSATPLTHSWSGGIPASQTFLAGWNNDGTQGTSGSAYAMTTGANSGGGAWCQSRFDWAGYFLNGTIEADLKVSTTNAQAGVEYRQTGWGNANNNGAYYVCIDSASGNQGIIFGYGQNNANNTSGSFQQVAGILETINSNTFYHIKIVVMGNRHTIYFNHSSSPIIDVLDSQYPTAGQIGFRAFAENTSAITASIENFSMITTTAGTWTSPATSLSSLSTCGYNQICWTDLDSQGQVEASTVVLASVDGGTTWMQCTNGAEIPQLPRGTSTSGKSLVLQMILSSNTPPISTPVIMGLSARICGNYGTVTGTRISPALPLTSVGYVASSNAMYNANIPTSTTLSVATSQDGATWSTVGNNGAGAALPYWTNQPSATQDLFANNTSANYTNTAKSGGSAASVYYDTANSRIVLSGGSGGLYLNSSISCADVDLLCDMDESDAGGLVWHFNDTSDYYELGVYDASSSAGFTNQLRLYKVSSGTRSLLGSASSIVFTRGNFHRVRVKMKSGLINIYWDGTCIQSYLDTSPLGSGQVGLRNDGGTSRYYQLWIQPLGTNLSGQVLYTKVTMSTSDPSQMPQLFTLVAAVRGPSIATGATIYQLHPVTLPFAAFYSAEMDTLVQVSGDYYWYIDKWRQMHFGLRQARPGAFPIQSVVDSAGNYSGYLLYQPSGASGGLVTVTASADPLRNQQIVTDVTGLVTPPPEIKVADGSTTSWTLGYPVYSAPTITVNNAPATVGVQGVDNNKSFYWQPGSSSINYDSTLPKLPSGVIISITYVGESTVNVVVPNNTAIATQAALEGNSGIIAEIEDANSLNTTTAATFGMTTQQATAFANGLLAHFGFNDPVEMIGTIMYPGLVPGTVIPLFLEEMGQWNVQLPVIKVTTTAFMGNNGIVYLWTVDATSGANVSQWQRVWF